MALLRLHLHILSCSAINVTTGTHRQSQHIEYTMENLFFSGESSPWHVHGHTTVCSLSNAKAQAERLVGSGFTLCLGKRPRKKFKLAVTTIPSKPLASLKEY